MRLSHSYAASVTWAMWGPRYSRNVWRPVPKPTDDNIPEKEAILKYSLWKKSYLKKTNEISLINLYISKRHSFLKKKVYYLTSI